MSHAVFLSFASQDAGAVQKIAEALRAGSILVPVVTDGTEDREALVPDEFRAVQSRLTLVDCGLETTSSRRRLTRLSPRSTGTDWRRCNAIC